VVVNKLDLPAAQARWPELHSAFVDQGYEALAVSAITRQGVDALVFRLAQFLAEERRLAGVPNSTQAETDSEVETIVIKPPASHFEVERRRKTFHVTARGR